MGKTSQQREPEWPTREKKSWWSKRSNLEKKLLITIAATAVCLFGYFSYTGIALKGMTSNSNDFCDTPSCLQAAAQIINHIDPSVNPCDDFFKFACGKFIQNIHGDVKASSIQTIEDEVQRQFDEIIKEPIHEEDPYVMQLEKKFFQACMNESAVEDDSIGIFKKHLQKLGGWPVVVGYVWKERLFRWTEMVGKLRQLGYSFSMMLDIRTILDPLDNARYIIHVSDPYIPSVKEEYKELYKKYMTDVAVAFGAKDAYRVSLEMEKVLDFRESLKKVAGKSTWSIYNNGTDTNYTAKLLETRFTVEDFQIYNDEIDWLKFLNAVLRLSVNITSQDYVVFPDNDFLEDFFRLIQKTHRRIQANYIIWTVIEHVMPFFPKELKYLEKNFTCLTKEDSSVSTDRFDYCKKLLQSSNLPEPSSVMYARKYLSKEKRESVKQLLQSVQNEFVALLQETSWMDEVSKEKALEKADAITQIVGAPGDYFDDDIFNTYHVYNNSEGGSFLEMVLRRFIHESDIMLGRINSAANESKDSLYYHLITKVNAMYSPLDNSIILPAGILQGIFYNFERPMYLNYGSLGSIVGHELTHGFCKDASKFDKEGNEANMWSEETEKGYDEAKQCIIEAAEEFDVEDTELSINGTLTLEENIADFTGLRVSYSAYRKWVEGNEEENKLPGVNYTPNQLFWISAISYECYKLSGDKLQRGLEKDSHAHNSFRATAPMRNNDNFASDFDCPLDSNMNPQEKCQVF